MLAFLYCSTKQKEMQDEIGRQGGKLGEEALGVRSAVTISVFLRRFFSQPFQNGLEQRGIIAQNDRGEDAQKEIDNGDGKRDRQGTDVWQSQHCQKTDGVRQPMRQNALVALDDEALNIFRIIWLKEILFAKAAKSSKLPDPILPCLHPQLFVKPSFRMQT